MRDMESERNWMMGTRPGFEREQFERVEAVLDVLSHTVAC